MVAYGSCYASNIVKMSSVKYQEVTVLFLNIKLKF